MKRIVLVLAVVCLVLAGCGQGEAVPASGGGPVASGAFSEPSQPPSPDLAEGAEEELLKYVLSEFMAKQETVRIGSGDIVSLNELYERISGYVEESLLEELNQRLLRRFQLTPVLSAFIQGFADDLLFQLPWRDPESSKQIFQILLDVLPGEA